MANPRHRPLLFKTPEELRGKVDKFFEQRKEAGIPPTVEGLALALGTNAQTLINYGNREAYADIVEDAKSRVADIIMSGAAASKYNATIAVWVSKNHYGYRDVSHQVIENVGAKEDEINQLIAELREAKAAEAGGGEASADTGSAEALPLQAL